MDNVGHFKGLARTYLPAKMRSLVGRHSLKNDMMELAKQNGVKVYKSWTKKKMIQHY